MTLCTPRAKSTFLIVTKTYKKTQKGQAGRTTKQEAAVFSSAAAASHNVILFESLISNHAKVRTCCVSLCTVNST